MSKKSSRPHLSITETGWNRFWKDFWSGTKPIIEQTWIVEGHVSKGLKQVITYNINQIISAHSIFKIGKTGDSYIRSDHKDYRNDYEYMYLLYRSTSKRYVSLLEEYYIAKYMESHPEKNQNKRIKAPGKSMYSYDGYYYLYLVCADD